MLLYAAGVACIVHHTVISHTPFIMTSESCVNLLAVDGLASETCESFDIMSNAETFVLIPQTVKGCVLSDVPASSSRYYVFVSCMFC